jgi:hypothetical protein
MMSADPFVPDPMNGQAWNRYSYVINNPLALTDTNGYCFLGMCSWGRGISTFFGRTFGVLFRQVPILGSLFEIAAVALCPVSAGLSCTLPAAVASTMFVAGVTSGSLGAALRAGLIAGATAVAFFEVGEITSQMQGAIPGPNGAHGTFEPFSEGHLANIAGHALVGCASAVASGGKCGAGALAGGVTSAAGPFLKDIGFTGGLVARAALGGLASVAGGGKFANGAITASFGYLFNEAGRGPNDRHLLGVEAAMASYIADGYVVIADGPVAVVVPGSTGYRFYDFIVANRTTGEVTGVEVKTTLYDIIQLDRAQVEKDIAVQTTKNAYIASTGQIVDKVAYSIFCFNCQPFFIQVETAALMVRLMIAGVPTTYERYWRR